MKFFNELPKQKIEKNAIFLHYTGRMFGIGCSVFSNEALVKINLLKKRRNKSGFIILIPNIDWLKKYDVQLTPSVRNLLQQYWPGELSVVLEVPDPRFQAISQNNKIAFRVPTDKLLRELITNLGQPIISTSVNETGEKPVQILDDIILGFQNWFDFAVLPEKIEVINNIPSTIIEIPDGKIKLIREGSIPFPEIELSYKSQLILFVCTGNTCRSPIAEFLAKKMIDKNNLHYTVMSAGFIEEGIPISENSKSVLALNGIDASEHLSALLNYKMIRRSWLILTMTKDHKKKILQLYPASASKVYTISEFTGFNFDVMDPFEKDLEYYKKTFEEINDRVKIIFEKIKGER